MKPMLACDFDETKLKFPIVAMPKIDGVRGLNIDGNMVGRSLKPHANIYTREFFSVLSFNGFDGELAAELWTHPDLCRITTSAVNTHKGEPYTIWWLFDLLLESTADFPYTVRLKFLADYLKQLQKDWPDINDRIKIVPHKIIENKEELQVFEDWCLDAGFEGVILRDPNGKYKPSRCTVKGAQYMRIKRFVDAEAKVLRLIEGETNTNIAQTNELGLQYRTTHNAGMVPNGEVGALICEDLKTKEEIKVSAGRMTKDEARRYWAEPSLLVGQIIKYQHFPKGVKDKPRFPTFQCIRAESDIGDINE